MPRVCRPRALEPPPWPPVQVIDSLRATRSEILDAVREAAGERIHCSLQALQSRATDERWAWRARAQRASRRLHGFTREAAWFQGAIERIAAAAAGDEHALDPVDSDPPEDDDSDP